MENFPEQVKTFANRVLKLKDSILTEEATKTSVIMPFFQLLNYDVFNPEEFLPEFTADVGIKKGEKVDYAIMNSGEPIILVEAKSIQEKLTKHDSQLFRYFGTTKAKFAILTNGLTYRFYTDLEEQNKMDTVPFFEFNLLDIRDNQLSELYKFRKENFNIEDIITTASELKYTNEIKNCLKAQWDNPSDEFVSFILSDVYAGKKTKQVIEKFNIIVKKSLKEFVNDMMNDKIKAALNNNDNVPSGTANEVTIPKETVSEAEIVTTEEEMEGYVTVKILLKDLIDSERISYRDNLSYFNILIDNSIRKWVCRLGFNSSNKYIQFNDEEKTTITLAKVSDISELRDKIHEVAGRFL